MKKLFAVLLCALCACMPGIFGALSEGTATLSETLALLEAYQADGFRAAIIGGEGEAFRSLVEQVLLQCEKEYRQAPFTRCVSLETYRYDEIRLVADEQPDEINALVQGLSSYATSSLHGAKNGWAALADLLTPFYVSFGESGSPLQSAMTSELFAMCCIAELYDAEARAMRTDISMTDYFDARISPVAPAVRKEIIEQLSDSASYTALLPEMLAAYLLRGAQDCIGYGPWRNLMYHDNIWRLWTIVCDEAAKDDSPVPEEGESLPAPLWLSMFRSIDQNIPANHRDAYHAACEAIVLFEQSRQYPTDLSVLGGQLFHEESEGTFEAVAYVANHMPDAVRKLIYRSVYPDRLRTAANHCIRWSDETLRAAMDTEAFTPANPQPMAYILLGGEGNYYRSAAQADMSPGAILAQCRLIEKIFSNPYVLATDPNEASIGFVFACTYKFAGRYGGSLEGYACTTNITAVDLVTGETVASASYTNDPGASITTHRGANVYYSDPLLYYAADFWDAVNAHFQR